MDYGTYRHTDETPCPKGDPANPTQPQAHDTLWCLAVTAAGDLTVLQSFYQWSSGYPSVRAATERVRLPARLRRRGYSDVP